MFPNEIFEKVLSYVTDVKDICNCRLVSSSFKEIVENSREIGSFDKTVSLKFICLFPKLKHLRVPIHFNQNLFEKLDTITLRMKTKEIFDILIYLEDFLFSKNVKKLLKIYTKTSIYWISQYRYGKYEKADFEFNGIDEQLMDVCKCKTLISNRKPHHYYPVQNYVYLSTIEDLNNFDYFPSLSLFNYSWVPIKSENGNFENLKSLSAAIYEMTEVNPNIYTYEVPVLQEHIPYLKTIFPNLTNTLIIKDNILHSKRKQLYLNNIISAEEYIDANFMN